MKALRGLALLVAVASCNSILGIQDLSGGELDASTDGGGDDGSSPTATMRFLLVSPDVTTFDADGLVAIHLAAGAKLSDASYGMLSAEISVPLGVDQLELRTDDPNVFRTANVIYEREPLAGDHITAVIVGDLSSGAAEPARVIGIDDAVLANSSVPTGVRVVHAIADRPAAMSFGLAYPQRREDAKLIGDLGSISGVEAVTPGQPRRLRVGPNVTMAGGTEDLSFSLPAAISGTKQLLVVAGRQDTPAPSSGFPAVHVFAIGAVGGASQFPLDAAFFIVPFLDESFADLSISSLIDGEVLSRASSMPQEPMVVFTPPGSPIPVSLEGLSPVFNFDLPAATAGSQQYIAVIGRSNGSPPRRVVTITMPEADPGTAHWSFIHGAPTPSPADVIRLPDDFPMVSNVSFGSVQVGQSEPGLIEGERVGPAGEVGVAAFSVTIADKRSVLVLHGSQSANPASLRMTSTSLDRWPWVVQPTHVGAAP